MQVKLVRRWGSAQAGESVTVDDVQGRWLVDHNFGTSSGVQEPVQVAAAPGTDGPDPLAGGDATRRQGMTIVSNDKRDNRAAPVAGSPIQYNAGIAADAGGEGGNRVPGKPDSARTAEPRGADAKPGRRRA